MEMTISKEFRFEASHILPKHPGKCSRLHGHSWRLEVTVQGSVHHDSGFVMDYGQLSAKVNPLIEELDHRHLGSWDIPLQMLDLSTDWLLEHNENWAAPGLSKNFYPSSENLIVWIGERLLERGLDWHQLRLNETCTSSCVLNRADFDRGVHE